MRYRGGLLFRNKPVRLCRKNVEFSMCFRVLLTLPYHASGPPKSWNRKISGLFLHLCGRKVQPVFVKIALTQTVTQMRISADRTGKDSMGELRLFNNTVIIILEKLAEGGLDSGIQKNFNCAQKVLIWAENEYLIMNTVSATFLFRPIWRHPSEKRRAAYSFTDKPPWIFSMKMLNSLHRADEQTCLIYV